MSAPRDEADTAYFTLLRARDELDLLRRYRDYLEDERRRLVRFASEGRALADSVAAASRRALRHTDDPLDKAVATRRAVIDDELSRLPQREAAAAAFVDECERRHSQLRTRGT